MKNVKGPSSLQFKANDYPLTPGLRLIEASAGTGKTFAIAHLVLRLITEKKYPIRDILVVTFTEAAAAELRERICTRLDDALKGIEAIEQSKKAEFPSEKDLLTDVYVKY